MIGLRVAVFPKELGGRAGLDLVVLEPDATVADLAAALDPFAGEAPVYKRQLRGGGGCAGCRESCCTTSIIAPEPISWRLTAAHLGLTEAELADRCLDPVARAHGVAVYRSFPCTFLRDHLCSIYPVRSLICRLFICCPYTGVLEDLVHHIMGAGAAALRARLAARGLLGPLRPLGGAGYAGEFARWYTLWQGGGPSGVPAAAANPFHGAETYADLPLRAFCTAEMWRALTRAG